MSTDKAHFIVMKLQKYESKQVFATGATSLLHWSMMDVEIESAGRLDLTILMKQKDQSWTRCLLSPWTTITTFPSSSTAWGRPSTRMSSLPSRFQSSSLLRIERKIFPSVRESRICWRVEVPRKSCPSSPSWSYPSNVSTVVKKLILQIKFDYWDSENEFGSFSVALNTRRDGVMCRTLKVFLRYDDDSNFTWP